jgi:large conductance mechanosensitive channel
MPITLVSKEAADKMFDTARNFGERGLHAGFRELGGFRKFILRGNVVDMAVGIVIGAAFTTVVNGFVKDIITPLIPTGNGKTLSTFHVGPLLIGDFINTVIAFLIVAAVIYFLVVRPVTALQDRFTPHQEPATPTTRECPFCLSTVPLKATRCAYCTAQLPPADTVQAQAAPASQ